MSYTNRQHLFSKIKNDLHVIPELIGILFLVYHTGFQYAFEGIICIGLINTAIIRFQLKHHTYYLPSDQEYKDRYDYFTGIGITTILLLAIYIVLNLAF